MSASLTHALTGHHARMLSTSTFVSASLDTLALTAREKSVSDADWIEIELNPRMKICFGYHIVLFLFQALSFLFKSFHFKTDYFVETIL